ncbi:GGDEF domain-containing protein [Chitinibacteraceae bacterium HSL-7]
MTTPVPPVQPVEIARIALKRLAERGLPPTPENYTQFYNAIVTIKSPESKSNAELQQAWEILCQLDDALLDITDNTQSLLSTLAAGEQSMVANLGALRHSRHDNTRTSDDLSHHVEGLISNVIDSTQHLHASVSASHTDIVAIRDAVKQIGVDLEANRRLMEQDPLTGALNRQGLDHLLSREVKRCKRSATPQSGHLSIIMLDLDEFKKINDRFGHLAGDQVILHMANLAKAVLRETDVLVRYGGEEFLLLLPDTDLNGARYVAERLRLVASKTPYHVDNVRIDISFSAGVATLTDSENGRALILRADEALYRAKRGGRGRVEIAEAH